MYYFPFILFVYLTIGAIYYGVTIETKNDADISFSNLLYSMFLWYFIVVAWVAGFFAYSIKGGK